MMRELVLVMGNAGSGKTTLARRLAEEREAEVLSLDLYAFVAGPERRPLAESLAGIEDFLSGRDRVVAEGCYGDLLEALFPRARELLFLDPGIEACVAHCLARPFEPEKFATPADQDAKLACLLDFVRSYEDRADDLGRSRHLELFEAFPGRKRRYTVPRDYAGG